MQLEGTIDSFPLRELIEMITYSSVTGILELQAPHASGKLYFYDGRPYHAVAGEDTGFEAVVRLFELSDATFRFIAGYTSDDESIWHDQWELIEQAEYQAKQWKRVRQHIPSMTLVPTLLSHAHASHIHIDESTWPYLAAVDGQRNINDIAEHLGVSQLDVCVALTNLLEQKLIAIRLPRSKLLEPRKPQQQQAAENKSESTPGFLDRLLAQATEEEKQKRPNLLDEEPPDMQRSHRYVNHRYIKNG